LALSYCVQAIGLQRRQGSARRCRNPDTRVRVTLTGENVTGVHANSRKAKSPPPVRCRDRGRPPDRPGKAGSDGSFGCLRHRSRRPWHRRSAGETISRPSAAGPGRGWMRGS